MNDLPFELVFWGSIACSLLALVVLVVSFVLLVRWLKRHTPDDDADK